MELSKHLQADTILLKIHRDFNADEKVKYLLEKVYMLDKEVSSEKFKNGELQSQLSELTDEIRALKGKIRQAEEGVITKSELRKELYINDILMSLKMTSKQNEVYRKEAEKWKNRYYCLSNNTTDENM